MGKITVNHYLNKNVKPRFDGASSTYPLYVQVIVNRTNYKMKSNFSFWDGFIKESDLNTDFIQRIINSEKEEIEQVVAYLVDNNKKEFLNADSFKKLSSPLWEYLNNNFWRFFTEEGERINNKVLPNAFYNTTYSDIDEIIMFTQSEIEHSFSEEYGYLRIGMDALKDALWPVNCADLKINKISVFDFLFGDKRQNVLEAIYKFHCFSIGSDEDNEMEYKKVMNSLESVVFNKN